MTQTRYEELGYEKISAGLWRIVDLTDDMKSAIGPHYRTEKELLTDLDTFALSFGCIA